MNRIICLNNYCKKLDSIYISNDNNNNKNSFYKENIKNKLCINNITNTSINNNNKINMSPDFIISILILINFFTILITLFYYAYKYIETKDRKKWFIVEGNIGTGKSTFLKKLSYYTDIEIIYEPVSEWIKIKDDEGKNILEYFYTDMKRWSYTMQSMAFKSRLNFLQKTQKKKYRFVERSIWTDKYVFAQNCYDTGLMNKLEWSLYNKWYSWLVKLYNKSGNQLIPDGIIYLKASTEISIERINKRGRNEENTINKEYIQKISNLHDKWLLNEDLNIPLLIIDCDKDFEHDNEFFDEILFELYDFIKI